MLPTCSFNQSKPNKVTANQEHAHTKNQSVLTELCVPTKRHFRGNNKHAITTHDVGQLTLILRNLTVIEDKAR